MNSRGASLGTSTDAGPLLRVGALIRANYRTGPYVVTKVNGPCTCAEYLRMIEGDDTPSEPHYHLVLRDADNPSKKAPERWLNGYRPDGTNVWRDGDRIMLVEAVQLRMFR